MENMVSKVLQVLPGPPVQAQTRETEATLGSQASPAHLARKENQDVPEARDSPATQVTKEREVSLVSAEFPVSRVSLATLVTTEAKDPRASEALKVARVHLALLSHPETSVCPMATRDHLGPAEFPVISESLASLVYLEDRVPRGVQVLWARWAGWVLLVCLDLLETPDPLVSPEPPENKVCPARPACLARLAAWGAAAASATPW